MSGSPERTFESGTRGPEDGGTASAAPPLVSVIVRTLDRRAQLLRALASVAAQTYTPIEAIVVNDGGAELDVQVLRAAAAPAALTYLRLDPKCGRGGAANAGVAAARGALIAFLDDDDELLPHHVGTLAAAMRDTGAGVAYTDCEIVDRDIDRDGAVVRESSRGRFPMSRDFSPADLRFENYIPLICVLVERRALTAAGGFDETLELFEDWDLFLRLSERTSFVHVPEITARYVQWSRAEQVAFSGGDRARDSYLRILAKHGALATPEATHAFVSAVHAQRAELLRQIAVLEVDIRDLTARLETSERLRAEAEAQATERARDLQHAEGEVGNLRTQLGEASRTLQSIADSRAWKLLNAYRTGVKESLLPAGSKRREIYNRVLRTGELRRSAATPGAVAPAGRVVRERFLPPTAAEDSGGPLDVRVSVVIPTLDAGALFRPVLERLRAQRGVRELEVIAVDSGSTDGTLALCAKHGVRVVPYPGGTFNHGVARNAGADAATGDYLLFMSQDVTPIGLTALADMVRPLHGDPRLAAVSARQVPRSDADLFTCWQIWCYTTKVLAYPDDTTVAVDAETLAALPPHERRRAAQLDNVFACVRRDVFDRLRFREMPIAEDLDLGLRLLAEGHALGFLSSVAVVHSHVRPAAYHLRRSFMETRVLSGLLGTACLGWKGHLAASMATPVRAAIELHRRVGAAVAALPSGRPADALDWFRASLDAEVRGEPVADASLVETIDGLYRVVASGGEVPDLDAVGLMLKVYLGMLGSFREFLERTAARDGRGEELRTALFKLCGDAAGVCLADFANWVERRGGRPDGIAEVAAALSRGV